MADFLSINFERLIFLFFDVPTLPVIVLYVVGVFPIMVVFIYTLSDSILRRVVPFLRSSINDRYVSYNVTNVYYFDFLIGAILNKVTLLSVL